MGDPFSNFVYKKYNGYNRIESMCKTYEYEYCEGEYVYNFKNAKFYPLYDALGSMFDFKFAKELQVESEKKDTVPTTVFHEMVRKTKQAGMLEDDYVYHVQGMTRKQYLRKIRWRIINNLTQDEGVGFASREKSSLYLKHKKYLFIPYSMLIIPTLVDAIYKVIKFRDLYLINHFYYSEATFVMIVWYSLKKMIGNNISVNSTYK